MAWRLVACAVALCAGSCSLPESEWFGHIPDPDPTHFRLCNSGEPEYIDPAMATATNDLKVLYQIHDGLTVWDLQALPEPSIATSWDVAPDMKRFTFHLRRDAKWSDGNPITSEDFYYSLARVLHPLTASRNAESLWRLENGEAFTANKVRLVLRPSGPFAAGEAVLLDDTEKDAPDSNSRRARVALELREETAPSSKRYARVPAGEELTIVELGGPGCPGARRDVASCDWAYVFWGEEDGVYGWTPLAGLDEPNAERDYQVVAADPAESARKGTVKGRDLLMVPEVLGIETPDPYTLVLITRDPVPYLVDMTPQRAFRLTPRRAVSRWPKRWTRPENIITSGEFHLVEWKPRDKLEMVKSKTFWGRDAVKLERLTIYSMNDQAANANVYYQGGCDAVVSNNIPASYLPVLAGETGARIKRKDYTRSAFLGSYFYVINVNRYPNVHFRRALSHVLDRRMLPKILKGGQLPSESYTPGTPFAQMSDEELAKCGVGRDEPGFGLFVTADICYRVPIGPRYDLEAAKRELELAIRELGGKLPKVVIRYNVGVEYHKTIAEWIQHEWTKHLGITVEVESQEWQMLLKAIRDKDYDVARLGTIGNMPDPESEFITSQYRCTAPDNKTGYCNQEFEAIVKKAEETSDRKQRVELIRQAEQLMIGEAPIVPLYVYTQHTLQKPYVRGLEVNVTDQHQFRTVWIDPDWKQSIGTQVAGAAP